MTPDNIFLVIEEQIQYLKVMQGCINNTKVTVTISDIGFDSSSKPLYNAIVNLNNYQFKSGMCSKETFRKLIMNHSHPRDMLIANIEDYITKESSNTPSFQFNFGIDEIYKGYSDLYTSIDKIILIIHKKTLGQVKTISKSEDFKDKKKKAIIYYAEQSMHKTFNSISKKYKKLGFSSEEIEIMCKKYIDRAIIKKVLE